MFGIDSSEFLLVALVALVVIGPKDLPKAMRVVGYWVGRVRGVTRQFRAGFDQMVREAELEEMEKRWAAENARIMAEHPPTDPVPADPAYPAPGDLPESAAATDDRAPGDTSAPRHDADMPEADTRAPVMVEKPQILPAHDGQPAAAPDGKVAS